MHLTLDGVKRLLTSVKKRIYQLIRVAPDVAEIVLDHSIRYSTHGEKHKNYTIEYNFEFLDLHPDKQMADPYFAPATIVMCQHDKLLCHPLVLAFINHKWRRLEDPIYFVNMFFYVLFVAMVTFFIVAEKDQ